MVKRGRCERTEGAIAVVIFPACVSYLYGSGVIVDHANKSQPYQLE